MKYYLIITKANGEQERVELEPGQVIPVEPGDDVVVYEENGTVADVTLQPDEEDLDIIFEEGYQVTLDEFYKLAGEGGDPITVSTREEAGGHAEAAAHGEARRGGEGGQAGEGGSAGAAGEDGTNSLGEAINVSTGANGNAGANVSFGDGVGNLPTLSDFTLMRLSNTGFTAFQQAELQPAAIPRTPAIGESQPDDPTAMPDIGQTMEGQPTILDLIGNDGSDAGNLMVCEIGGISIQPGQTIELRSGSTVTMLPDGRIEFLPGDNYTYLGAGESTVETFSYVICDELGNTSTATVSVTVSGENDPPTANNDIIDATEGLIATINPLNNDTDPDTSDTLTITGVQQPAGGSVQLNPDGSLSFDPGSDFDHLPVGATATQTITYSISDGNGGTDTAEITITVTGVNDDPVANPDTAPTDEDTPIVLDPLGNDTDVDGDPLNICGIEVGGIMINPTPGVPITLDSGAIVTVMSDGTIQYDQNGVYEYLDGGESATDIFTYKIDDGNGGTATSTFTVEISGVEDPTVTNPDAETTNEDTTVVVDVLLNDSDLDASDNPLTVAAITTPPSSGSVTINPGGGDVSFDPGTDFQYLAVGESATVTFTYQTNTGATEVATVTVTGVNDDPVANPDTDTVPEDTPITLTPLANDTDPDGSDTLNICGIEVGGVMVNPTPGVPITLDSGAVITVLANGDIQYDQNGTYEYLDDGESATDIFTYKIDDGNGGTSTSTYTVTITGSDDPTVVNPDAETTNEDTPVVVDVLLNDSDPDASDNPLTVASIVSPPSSGSVTINPGGGDVSFDPGTDFQYLAVGESATVTFTYQTNTGATEVATVTVTGVNDDPVANPDTDTVPEDTPITLTPLANDTDPDGSDTLNICGIEVGGVMVNPTPGVPITLDSGAVITVLANGDIQYDQNGTYEYLDDGESATDIFTYKIDDGNGGTSTSTYTVTITGSDDPTVVNPDAETTNEDTPVVVDVLLNDSDPDASDNPLTVASIVSPPSSGSVTINPGGGDVSFDPGTDFQYLAVGESATVTFTYQTNTGATEVATVTVTGVNDDPVANPDTDTVPEDTPITLTPLANDTDPDGSDTLNICGIEVGGVMVNPTPGVPITLDSGAVITVLANGDIQYDQNGTYEYLDDGESATDIFTYKIDDGNGGTSTSTYTVTITGADDPTITNPDAETGAEDTPISGDVLLNDSDPDASDNPLTVVSNTNPTNGTVVVNPDGTFTYTPNANYTGTDTFTYTTSTGATDTVTITVTPVNDAPVANPDTDTTDEDTPVNVDPLANDTDPDGDPLNICGIEVGGVMVTPTPGVPITLDSGATVTLLADGTIDYDSNGVHNSLDAGESATDIFTYKIDDGNGGTATTTYTVTINGLDDPTLTNPDAETTPEDTPVVGGSVLGNDSDPDAADNPLTVVSNTNPTNGTVVVNPDGTYTYTPNANYTGTDTFTYTTSTGATDVVTITITPVNDPPIANPDTDTVDEDTPITLQPLPNDTDPDGDPLTICGIEVGGVMVNPTPGVPITLDSGAIITVLANGDIQYDQNGTYNYLDSGESATDIFTYKVDDGNGGTATTTYTVTINGLDDPTLTNPDAETTPEDTPVVGGSVLGNDSDPDAADNPLTVVSNTNPTNGTVVVNPDGTYTYTPNANYTGTDTFTYTTSTGATDVVTITITPVNDPPIANPDTDTVDEDTPITLQPLPNDTDPDGDPLTICGIEVGGVMVNPTPGVPITLDSGAIITVLANGDIQYDQNGTYNYLDSGESATDIFTYKVDDGNGGTATTTYTVTINGLDDPTLTNPDAETTPEDTPVVGGSVLGNDSDPDAADNPLTVVSNTNPTNGTVVVNPDGTYTYTPNANYTGTDTFTYTTSTGATDVVTITITPVNDPPIANPDTDTVDEDTPITLQPLPNDTDPDGDPLTICGIEVGGVMVNPTPGVPITLDSGAIITVLANGDIQYDQNGTYNYLDSGESATDIFTYKVDDGNGGTATTTYTVTINGLDDPTLTNPDNETTAEDTPVVGGSVLGNDSDPDASDNPLTVVSNTNPTNGTVVVNPDGTYTYTPNTNYTGTDTFTYTTSTGATDFVTITITPVNDPPVASPDTDTVDEDTMINLTPLPNDSDPDGDPLTICGIEVGGVMITPTPGVPVILNSGASVTLLADGTLDYNQNGNYNYLDTGETATDIFTYKIDDGNGGTATTTYTVTINGLDDPTLTNPDNETTAEDTPVVGGSVLGNDSDPDASDNPLTVVSNTNPTNGTVVVNPDGTYTYTPNTNYTGTDTFTYTTSTGATDVVTITITPVNDLPDAVDDADAYSLDTPESGTVLGNDTDPEGDPLTVIANGNPSNGTVVIDAAGNYTYTPNSGFTGSDSFTYTISDGNGGTDIATVTLSGPTNSNPDAVDDTDMGVMDTPESGSVLGNDTDPETDPLTVIANGNPSNGSVVIDAAGNYTYTPNTGFTGTDTFTYTISDGNGGTDTATVTLTIDPPVAQPPEANPETVCTEENSPLVIQVLDNDSDPNSDPLTITEIDGTAVNPGDTVVLANGSTVTLNADGTVTYDANGNYSTISGGDPLGVDNFAYTISDGNGGTDTTTVEVVLIPTTVGANDNIGYAAPDNAAEIYEFRPDTTTPPVADTITIGQTMSGEGMTMQPSTGLVITFDTSDNIFHVDPSTGNTTMVGTLNDGGSSLSGTVLGASFYVDPGTLQETMYVLMSNGDLYKVDPSNGNVDPNGFGSGVSSVSLSGDISQLESIAIDPVTGLAYGTDDRSSSSTFDGDTSNPDIYSIDLATGVTTFVVGVADDPNGNGLDGEALEFGNDGTLYIEQDKDGIRSVYEVDLNTGALTEAAQFGGSGDVEGMAFNAGFSYFAPQVVALGPTDLESARTGSVLAAKIVLTNTQPGDSLVIGTLPTGVSGGVSVDSSGNSVVTLYANNGTGGAITDFEAAIDAVSYTNATPGGPTRNISVTITDPDGTVSDPATGTVGFTPPIVIDLDGDGVEFVGVDDGALIDVDDDGQLEQSAWAGDDDAVLIFDANNNNDIDGREEFVFADYATDPNATDMEGLREAFDSNDDGILSAEDEAWADFKLWQDADGDGQVGEGEMITLDEAGIESIGLVSDGESYSAADGDVYVHGESVVTFTDGTTTTAADAAFDYEELVSGDEPLEITTVDGDTIVLDDEGDIGAAGADLLDECPDCGPDGEAGSEGGVPNTPISAEDEAAVNGAGLL